MGAGRGIWTFTCGSRDGRTLWQRASKGFLESTAAKGHSDSPEPSSKPTVVGPIKDHNPALDPSPLPSSHHPCTYDTTGLNAGPKTSPELLQALTFFRCSQNGRLSSPDHRVVVAPDHHARRLGVADSAALLPTQVPASCRASVVVMGS